MRWSHFEALAPVCPRCRSGRGDLVPLSVGAALEEEPGILVAGILHCTDDGCQQEYPVVDGIPIIVPDVRAYLADNLFHLTLRTDHSETIESLLGDAAGPGTAYDATRQHLSTYAWDHYHALDTREPDDARPGAAVRCLARALDLMSADGRLPPGPTLDVGCSVGGSTFDLAERTDGPVLGIDINFSMLQMAQRILREGVVRYPLRRVGLVYDLRAFTVRMDGADRVDFWACDALALPFPAATFGSAVALNVLDCVASPVGFLDSMARVLRGGGRVVLATPYDWSVNVTPVEAWIGGHSQRGPDRGASEPLIRSLLTPGAHPQSSTQLHILGEIANVPWSARLHDRSTVQYSVHVVCAEADADASTD